MVAEPILGAVLAGGQSRRFGSNKALARLGNKTLIEWAIEGIAAQTDEVVICGRAHAGYPALPDRPVPNLGPLGGLAAALYYAGEKGFDAVLTTGCDMPVFPPAIRTALVGHGPATVEGHQLIGYWPVHLGPQLDAHLATSQDRSIRRWMDIAGCRIVTLPDLNLPNINTPDDLKALSLLARSS
jgi:molybdopterin-guanine dinucleotide biosynthesis protein A